MLQAASWGVQQQYRLNYSLLLPKAKRLRIHDGEIQNIVDTLYTWEDLVSSTTGDREKVLVFLARYGLIANSRDCPCGGHMGLVKKQSTNDDYAWRCGCPGGATEVSVRRGSFFENSNLPLQKIIMIMFKWAQNQPAVVDDVMRSVGVSKRSLVDWFNFCRDIAQNWCRDNAPVRMMGGPNKIVEIDESLFFKAKYNRGAALMRPQVWCLGLIERGTDNVHVEEVNQRDAATLVPIIEDNVLPDTLIITDGWGAYRNLDQLQRAVNGVLQQKYQHLWVNHQVNFVAANDPRVHTQSIEATWGAIKRELKMLHTSSRDLFPTYLYQYMFRRAHKGKHLFAHFLFWVRFYYPV